MAPWWRRRFICARYRRAISEIGPEASPPQRKLILLFWHSFRYFSNVQLLKSRNHLFLISSKTFKECEKTTVKEPWRNDWRRINAWQELFEEEKCSFMCTFVITFHLSISAHKFLYPFVTNFQTTWMCTQFRNFFGVCCRSSPRTQICNLQREHSYP